MRALKLTGFIFAALLVTAETIYLIAANGFLHTQYFDSVINGNPSKLLIRTEFAYSIIPGWVNADEIQVRGQDDSSQWLITVQNAHVNLSLNDLLLHNKLHFTSLDAERGSFRIRSRNLPKKNNEGEIKELPPISGFDDESLLRSRAEAEKKSDDQARLEQEKSQPHQDSGGLSELAIDQVRIPAFSELWINANQFIGKMAITGSFQLVFGHHLEVPDARIEVESGTIERRGRSIAKDLSGAVEASIHNYELNHDPSPSIFKAISGDLTLKGKLDSLDPFSFMFKNQDWFRLQRADGNFALDTTIQSGRIASVHAASLVANHLLASFSHFIVQGAAKVIFEVDRNGIGSFEFGLPICQLLAEKDHATIIDGSNLRIVVKSPDLELDHLYTRIIASVALPDSKIADLTFLNRWVPHSTHLAVIKGSGRVDANLTVANYRQDQIPPGKVSIVTEGLEVQKGQDMIDGKVSVLARVKQIFHSSVGIKELEISGSEVNISGSLAKTSEKWVTDVKVSHGSVRPDSSPFLIASIDLHVPDLGPFLNEFGIQEGLGKFAQNILLKGNFEGTSDFKLSENWIDLDHMKLNSDGARMEGLLHLKGDDKKALAIVHYGILSAGIELENDKTHFRLEATDQWFKETALKFNQQ